VKQDKNFNIVKSFEQHRLDIRTIFLYVINNSSWVLHNFF